MPRYDSLAGSDRDILQVGTYELDYRRPEHSRETSTTELVKNSAVSHLTAIDRSAGGLASTARPLRHFYLRSVVGLLGPCIVLFYFLAIWRVYLAPLDSNNPLAFGAPGATWVYYSWFVAGVIGLNLSTYGLAGIEAAMLMEPRWNVKDAMRLMMHADVTWSGPGGWMKTMKWIVQTHRSDGPKKLPGRLWFLLALPSILVFIAWPLSGLCLETTDGFLHGTPGDGSQVIGFSYSNFNERNFDDAYKGAGVTWSNSLDSRIPGQGAAYTPEDFDRSEHAYLEKVPVVLPKEDGLSRTFLTAQAATPIEGSAWGLLLQYNCSIVDKLSDLSLLKDRKPAAENGILNATQGILNYYVQGNSSQVFVQNQTNPSGGFQAYNIHAVAEMAYQIWPSKEAQMRQLTSSPNGYFSKTSSCYYNQDLNITGDYPGIEQERIFEMVLWQHIYNSSFGDATPPKYNYSLDRSIAELYGAYDYNNFQYTVPANISKNFKPAPMTAIGVQCRSSSSVGTAQINGVRSTYSNFTRTDTPINVQRSRCAGRFGAETLGSMIPQPASITSSNSLDGDWLNSLFTSVAAPPLFYATYTDDPDSIDTGTGYMVRLGYLQSSQLRQSLLRAYAAYAVQLMYNGGQGFTTREGSEVSFTNPNVTPFVAGTVIKQGTMHVGVPLAFFALWALVSTSLCACYGFRKRWTEILDGHTLFRLGVDLDEEDRKRIQSYSNTGEVETSIGLNDIPGLVGDTRPGEVVGRIGLVRGSVAVKGKLYH